MADTKTYTTNYNLVKPGQDDFYNVDDFNSNADILDSALHQASTNISDHKNAKILDHPDNSVTDNHIGNRTITDTLTATTGANTLTKLLSMLGNMIKQITGKSNWYTAPAITLEAAKTHVEASAPHNGHETPTGAQSKADAAKSAANSYTDSKTANLVNTSDTRLSNARPAAGGTSSCTEYVNNDNTSMRFHWSGKGDQPSWLWGGNAPGDMYLYNPSNFNVSYAATAGSAPANGGNADTVDGYHASQLLSSFDAGHSFAANGWQKLSNGWMLQWGYGSLPAGSTTSVTFPIAFPTNVYCICPTISASTTGGNRYAIWSSGESRTGFTCINSSSTGAENFYWFAIGN